MASATVVAAGLMGAVTGSDNVSCVIMSKMALPELKRLNYADSLATASVAAGAPLAILIPPSMAFIMYAMLTENSVGSLFMAGIIPGIVMIIAFVIAITITCTLNPALGPKGEKFTRREKLISLKGVVPVIILFLIVLGSIYAGICTATEAGALGSAGALVIALIGREIDGKKIVNILVETVLAVGFVVFMLVGTFVFIKFIALSQLPFAITALITNLSAPSAIIIIAIGIMYVVFRYADAADPHDDSDRAASLSVDPGSWLRSHLVRCFRGLDDGSGAISHPLAWMPLLFRIVRCAGYDHLQRLWPFIIADIIVIILVAIFPGDCYVVARHRCKRIPILMPAIGIQYNHFRLYRRKN